MPPTDEAPPEGRVIKPFGKALDEMMRVPQLVAWIAAGVIVLLGFAASSVGPAALTLAVTSAVGLFVASALPVAIISRPERGILSLFLFILLDQNERWTRLSPDEPIPMDDAASRRWMLNHPVDLADRDSISFHGSFLLRLRNFDAAENLTRRMPEETPVQRYDREISLAQVEFLRGGDGDLAGSRRLLDLVPEGPERERAVRDYAFEETDRALAVDGDWRVPLVALNSPRASNGIGSIATLGVARLGWVTPRFVFGWIIAFVVFVIASTQLELFQT